MPKSQTVIRARFTIVTPTDRYSELTNFRLGFLTDYTINKGYGCMTAYHGGRWGGERNGRKKEENTGLFIFPAAVGVLRKSVWLRVDTNGTTQRRDKALRHFFFFNSSNLISLISDTQVFSAETLSRER